VKKEGASGRNRELWNGRAWEVCFSHNSKIVLKEDFEGFI